MAQARIDSLDPFPGEYRSEVMVTIQYDPSSTAIHYTLDGNDPTTDSPLYSGPIRITNTVLLSLRGFAEGEQSSGVWRGQYSIFHPEESATIVSIIGSGQPGFSDGPAATASFNQPSGICVDRGGNLYVVDQGNHAIRKISPEGQVSTLAIGVVGNAVCVDSKSNVFVTGNQLIRKITPEGVASTFYDPPDYAKGYFYPSEITINNRDEIAVGFNIGVLQLSKTAEELRSFAGSDLANDLVFSLTFDAGGNLLIGRNNPGIEKQRPNGPYDRSCIFGECFYLCEFCWDDRRAANWMAADRQGMVYMTHGDVSLFPYGDLRLRKLHPDATMSTILRYSANPAEATNSFLNNPFCVDAHGFLYFPDWERNVIVKLAQHDWNDALEFIDEDHDGIPDVDEGQATPFVIGVDDRTSDLDGDGMSNADEYFAGTDPTDAASRFEAALSLTPGNKARLRWMTSVDRQYSPQFSDDLVNWANFGPALSGTGEAIDLSVELGENGRPARFFRVMVSPAKP